MAKWVPRMIREAVRRGHESVKWALNGNEKRTNITPGRRPIHDVALPYNGVDKHVEAPKASPEHVKASARVPCFCVPGHRDDAQ